MKNILLFIALNFVITTFIYAQDNKTDSSGEQEIYSLIDKYVQAREKKDSVLLKSILTADIDQLVSSGEWRHGFSGAMKGMMRSSKSRPGSRSIKIDKIRFLNTSSAIVDAKYEVQNTDDTTRKMWSTFIVIYDNNTWKITAIRNMLPSR